jgi:imidazolonepropionase-like amidohydrolase
MAYAQGTAGIKNAVRARVRPIEHGIYLDEEAIEVDVGPRDVAGADAGGSPRRPCRCFIRREPPQTVAARAKEVAEVHVEFVRAAVAAGVNLAMGTDSGVGAHGDNLDELVLMPKCAMSSAQALADATSSTARLCGLQDRTGRVAPGVAADLVVVEGDAIELPSLRERIRQVWQDGRPVARA